MKTKKGTPRAKIFEKILARGILMIMQSIEIYWQAMVIILLSLAGLGICLYIYKKKGKGEKLVCPIGSSCNDVIYSPYAKTFGFRNEIGGALYYIFTALIYFLLFTGFAVATEIMAVSLFASLCAFIFSIYLILVQALIIKKWCAWCVTSAILSTLIFFLAFLSVMA